MLVHRFENPVSPRRVVILGAGGFLSPVLRRVLEAHGTSVVTIGSRDLDLAGGGAPEKLSGLLRADDAVVMAAALTPDRGRDIGTLMKNLRMGESVCEAIGRTGAAHLVYISSDAVYDARFSSLLDEESTCEPGDLYAVMHIARERMLEQACKARGIPLAIVRPCAIYGPHDTHNSYGPNRFIKTAVANGRVTLFGEGEERRHHIHVNDVAEILRLSLLRGSTGRINAVAGEAVPFRRVAEIVAAASNGPVELECLPRAGAITHRHYDTKALVKAFPNFIATPLDEGITAVLRAVEGR